MSYYISGSVRLRPVLIATSMSRSTSARLQRTPATLSLPLLLRWPLPQVWTQRPLTPELSEYAATDVRYLHALEEALRRRLSRELLDKVPRGRGGRHTGAHGDMGAGEGIHRGGA